MASNHPVSGWSILDSIFWMMAGPAILIVSARMSYTRGNCWLAPASTIFLVVLAGVVVARCLDPRTADGEPSTAAHLQRFAGATIVAGLVVWVAANILGSDR